MAHHIYDRELMMNFRILAVAALIPVVAGCSRNVDTQAEREKLIATDREFSAMSVEQGTVEAFMYYAADSAVMYRNRSTPISGKRAWRRSKVETKTKMPLRPCVRVIPSS